ncbi:hypothetical protein KI387_012340, partial [Taxus chinensis]
MVDRTGRLEKHPFDRVPQMFGLPYIDMLPPAGLVYISICEAWGGPRGGRGWTMVTPGVPIAVRRVVHARGAASAPRAPLLMIGAAPAHSGEGDEPIDVDSDSEEFTREETEEETMGEGIGGGAGGTDEEDD